MSQELLYTSAPEGLNPNDQGFCTVACTEGMPRNLKELLENLTAYRQAEQPPHPVNFSHLIHTVGGKRYQILSRVSDYEKDYSGRTNKLAHHVALTIEELPAGGPAALLATSLFHTQWDGQTRWIPQGPSLPAVEAYRGPCRRWEALTGDPGWAGVLAESAADGSNRPMSVIFPAGEDMLPLVGEALGILPPEKAWTTSFSTYFTKLPAGVDCLWRFVLDGSPEAEQARSAGHGRVIDLVELQRSRRPAPDDNPYVEAARAGRPVQSQATFASATFAPTAPSEADASPVPTSGYELKPAEPARPPSPFDSPAKAPASPFGPRKKKGKRSSKLPLILGGIAVALCIGVGTLVYSMFSRDIPPSLPEAEADLKNRSSRNVAKKTSTEEFLSPQEEKRRAAAQKTEEKIDPKKTEDEPEKVVKNNPRPPEPKKEKTIPWDQSLVKLKGKLSLPERNLTQTLISNSSDESKPKVLTEIPAANPDEIDLTILSPVGSSKEIGAEGSKLEGFIIEPPEVPDEDDKTRRWIVKRKSFLGFDTQADKYEVGTFELVDEKLTFDWNRQAVERAKSNSLQYCLLEISKGDEKHRFQLTEPKIAEPLRYDLSSRNQELFLEVNSKAVDDPKDLHLDLNLLGVKTETGPQKDLVIGDKATFSLKDGQIEIDMTFQYDVNKGPLVEVNTCPKRRVLVFVTNRSNREPDEMESVTPGQRERIDQIKIQEMRLPTIFSDFERLPKRGQALAESLAMSRNFTMARREISNLQKAINNEEKPERIKELKEKQKPHKKLLSKYKKRMDVVAGYPQWCQEMKPRFQAIADSAKVGYSIYVIIDGEKVYLARGEGVPAAAQSDSKAK